MKYSIRLAALSSCGESLEHAARTERRESGELQSVIRQLGGLWGMSGIIASLRKEMQDMEEQVQITLMMAQAARRIHQIYGNMERSVTDAADCPFRLEPSGCGAPVFPTGLGSAGTAGSLGSAETAGTAASSQSNLQLLTLLENYLLAALGTEAAAPLVEQARSLLR